MHPSYSAEGLTWSWKHKIVINYGLAQTIAFSKMEESISIPIWILPANSPRSFTEQIQSSPVQQIQKTATDPKRDGQKVNLELGHQDQPQDMMQQPKDMIQ
jgi:hypothetical protein